MNPLLIILSRRFLRKFLMMTSALCWCFCKNSRRHQLKDLFLSFGAGILHFFLVFYHKHFIFFMLLPCPSSNWFTIFFCVYSLFFIIFFTFHLFKKKKKNIYIYIFMSYLKKKKKKNLIQNYFNQNRK